MFDKNLKYYRLQKNMTKKDLADALGLTPMAITNYESGKRRPDINQINKMAEALGIHVVDFLAARNTNLKFKHCEFRKNSKLTKGQQEYVRESVEEYFSRFFDAVECLGGNPLPEPTNCHCLARTGDYEEDAIQLRKYLGLPEIGPIDELVGLLENKGILVLELDIDSEQFSGMNGFVDEYSYVVINKNMTPERKRTTIIHELAHLFFIWDGGDEDASDEKEATSIAGAFLITKKDLFRELGQRRTRLTKDLILVCEEYGISMYLLVTRANQVGIMSSSLCTDFFIKANKANWRKNEPRRVKNPEEPLLFKQLVFRAINEEGISVQRGAELLKLSCADVEQYCGLMEVQA